jgi:hypothetical protein
MLIYDFWLIFKSVSKNDIQTTNLVIEQEQENRSTPCN